MYLNTERGNTNIDDQFKRKKSFKINFKLKLSKLTIFYILLALLIVGIIFYFFVLDRTKYFILLDGPEIINIYQGDDYIEPGYLGMDNKNNDLTSKVVIDNQVDIQTIGTYQIIYKLKNVKIIRTVNVVEKGIGTTIIYLQGDEIIELKVGQNYNEPGYSAIDSIDSNITGNVTITSNVDTSKVGTYRVVYTVTNSSGVTTSKTRTVIVKK